MNDAILLDARGLSCPEPAMMAKRAIENSENNKVEMLVDSPAARDNIRRMARSAGWTGAVEELAGGEFKLVLSR